MTRHILTVVLIIFSFCTNLSAGSGIFQTYAIVNSGFGNTYLAGGANADGAPSFNGTNFGTPATLTLNGGEVKTFKNGADDIFGANIFYRVYKQTDVPGAFIQVNLPFAQDLGNGDQRWAETAAGIDVLAAATAGNGDYFLEVYWTAPFNFGTHFDSDSGNNYKASFTVNILPVALTSFSANPNKNTIELAWETAQEINNDYFQIERLAIDNRTWEIIGKQQGAGNSDNDIRYTFADEHPIIGKNSYRLKQTDFDGQFEYSQIVTAEIRSSVTVNIFPNPTASELTISTPENFIDGEIRLFDASGKTIISTTINDGNQLDLSALNAGIYFFQMIDKNGNVLAEDKIRKL